ncbi:MAG: hypothetical protein JWO92_429 [Chitinophagaceae bacterium]|nr:hypothetical protein [Chitinophagaceae bacterium]
MLSQGLGQLLFIALVFLLTVALLIIGQLFKRRKTIRYVLWTLSLIVIIGSIIFYNKKPSDEREVELRLSGIYNLDTDNSKYDGIALKLYSNLTLTLKDNNTFFISKPTPLLKYLKGKWEYKDNGDFGYVEYSFDSLDVKNSVVSDLNIWTFGGNELKDSNNKNLIVFRRRK